MQGIGKATRLSREFSADKGTLRVSGGRKAYGSQNGAHHAHLRLGRVAEVRHTVGRVRLNVTRPLKSPSTSVHSF